MIYFLFFPFFLQEDFDNCITFGRQLLFKLCIRISEEVLGSGIVFYLGIQALGQSFAFGLSRSVGSSVRSHKAIGGCWRSITDWTLFRECCSDNLENKL